MYIEFIWRNSQKKFKLIPTNNISEKFQGLKKSYESFEYIIALKVYSNYAMKTIFLSLREKIITNIKKSYGIKGCKKNSFPFLEFETGSIRLDKNVKNEKSGKWQIEKIIQKKFNFQLYKILNVNKKSIITTKKKIFKGISILSNNNKINLYCFALKINLT